MWPQESAQARAARKKAIGVEGVIGLVEVDQVRLQEYESSLLNISNDSEKEYYLWIGYNEAFRKMVMSWGW